MQLATQPHPIIDAVNRIKKGNRRCLTNYFLTADKLAELIHQRVIYFSMYRESIYIIRREASFDRVYFLTAGRESLESSLNLFLWKSKRCLVMDLVGAKKVILPLAQWFTENSLFKKYALFQRMGKIGRPEHNIRLAHDDPIYAKTEDVDAIYAILNDWFDPFKEHLPSYDEVQSAIENRGILLIKGKSHIHGLLFFDCTGFSSTLRYWWVAPEVREKKYGSQLMRRYFSINHSVTKFLLWVSKDNTVTLSIYERYGYRADGLCDIILKYDE